MVTRLVENVELWSVHLLRMIVVSRFVENDSGQ